MGVKFGTREKRILIGAALVLIPVLAFIAGQQSATQDEPIVTAEETPEKAPAPVETVSAPEPAPEPEPVAAEPEAVVRSVEVESGDNLMNVLIDAGAERFDAHVAIQSLQGVYDPRRDLRVGDELQVTLDPAADGGTGSSSSDGLDYVLSGLRLPVDYDRQVVVDRNEDGGFVAREVILPLQNEFMRVDGVIDSSLFVNARDAGVPVSVLIELIRIFSFDVDFQRDIWRDDRFEVMFERQRNDDGIVVHNGEIQYAKLTLRGTELPLYRFETPEGNLDYFNAKGESVRKALMKTPIDGARLSSRFGNRKHPILGYTRLHAGVDFAAPTGTPIYAAGDGTVTVAGTNGGYGKYIKIRHNGTYSTAYAHLNGYARGIRKGKRVRQGQVIGYVGSTGRSTGPHLHYEIHRNGKQINPLGLKLPSGEKLTGKTLEAFQAHRDEIDRQFELLSDPRVVAKSEGSDCASATPDCTTQ